MATISSNVGLFSGLDYGSLVDQLIAIDARPRDRLVQRMSTIDAQRTAFLDISARVTALLSRVNSLAQPSFFRANKTTSSNSAVLSATAGATAQPGAYSFIVRALASAHQLVSRGFATADATLPPGTLTLESAAARVDRQTTLEELNGYSGVQRGSFKITDSHGNEAVIDIREAQTIGDVLDDVNAAGIGVKAELCGEALVLRDTAGGTQGIRVREVGDGRTGADLGFGAGHTYTAGAELVGTDVIYLADGTPLSALNDGLGVRHAKAGGDFTIQSTDPSVNVKVDLSGIITDSTRLERLNHGRGVEPGTIRITTRDGHTTDVDLSAATTIGEVKQAIESAAAGVSVVMAGGRLIIMDATNAEDSNFIVTDVQGHAARDLGILGNVDNTKIDGRTVLQVDTLADVVAAINYGQGNQQVDGAPTIQAAIGTDGRGLTITDHGNGANPSTVLAVVAGSNSKALFDLGFQPGSYDPAAGTIAGERVAGGLDTVLLKTLNGGNGMAGGTIHIEANGAAADVDLQDARTLRDVVEQINAVSQQSNLGIEAGYDAGGTRLLLTNSADDPGPITISDVIGQFAESAGIAGSATRVRGKNLQRQYISEQTRLQDLNAGQGAALGKIRITDSQGMTGIVDLAADHAETLQDVIDAINALDIGVEARINETGDGLLLGDTAGGTGTLLIVDQGGTTARDLNLLSTPVDGKIDGSYEFKIDTSEAATLNDVASRIQATMLASASLLHDGSATAPYRLSVTSRAGGRNGELILDDGAGLLALTTMTRAQDARVLLGSTLDGGILVTSPSNTLTNTVQGVTLNLSGVDDQPVTITVNRDADSLVSTLKDLVNDYNNLSDRMDQLGGYNADTQTGGVLLGDATLQLVENRLFRAFSGSVPGATGTLTRLSQLGVRVGETGLTFDEAKFREVYNADPEAVTRFFTAVEGGLAPQLKESLQRITETGGLLKRQDAALQDQKELLSDRVDQLNALLQTKRERLLNQFRSMEQALAQLQSQQSVLGSFTDLLTSLGALDG